MRSLSYFCFFINSKLLTVSTAQFLTSKTPQSQCFCSRFHYCSLNSSNLPGRLSVAFDLQILCQFSTIQNVFPFHQISYLLYRLPSAIKSFATQRRNAALHFPGRSTSLSDDSAMLLCLSFKPTVPHSPAVNHQNLPLVFCLHH